MSGASFIGVIDEDDRSFWVADEIYRGSGKATP